MLSGTNRCECQRQPRQLHSSILIDIVQVRISKNSKCLRVLRVQLYLATVYTQKYQFGAEGVFKSLGAVLDYVPR